jgi:hypothetical protein
MSTRIVRAAEDRLGDTVDHGTVQRHSRRWTSALPLVVSLMGVALVERLDETTRRPVVRAIGAWDFFAGPRLRK